MQGLECYGNGEMGESDFRFHGGGSDGGWCAPGEGALGGLVVEWVCGSAAGC